MTKLDNTLLYRIYLIKSDIFIGFQNLGTGSRLDRTDISDVSDIFGFRSGFRALALALGRIYLIPIRYIRGVKHI
jgi:hypothetical protein